MVRKIYKFIYSMVRRYLDHELSVFASQVTYYLTLVFFPALILLISTANFLLSETLLDALALAAPGELQDFAYSIIEDIMVSSNVGVLSAAITALVIVGTKAVRSLMRGINNAYGLQENRNFIKIYFIAFAYLGLMLISIVALLILTVFGGKLYTATTSLLGINITININPYTYIVPMIILLIVLLLLYSFISCKRMHIRDTIIGAALATVGIILASAVFRIYVDNFSSYPVIYGSITSIMVLLTWLYIISIVILLGAELNGYIMEKRAENGNNE